MLSRAKLLLLLGTAGGLGGLCLNGRLFRAQAQDAARPSAEILASAPATLPWTLKSQVNEVTVFFSVRDGQRFVQNLSVRDIHITDNGKPALHISDFRRQEDLQLRVGLLIDTSGSVNPRFRFEKEASIQFLRAVLRRGRDHAFVMSFSDHTNLSQDYTNDPNVLASAVSALRNGGGTAFFDAVRTACEKLADDDTDVQPTARVLVVLSDGDNNAGHSTLKNAIDAAQFRDVTIYTINTRIESLDPRATTAQGDKALKSLAVQTGGRLFSRITPNSVGKAFTDIEQEMRNRYALFYQPEELVQDGRFRQIHIEANKSGKRLHVRSRKGYYATRASSN